MKNGEALCTTQHQSERWTSFTRWFEPGSPSSAKMASAESESPLVTVGHPFVLTSFSMQPCSPALKGLSQPARQQPVESDRQPHRSHRRDCRQVAGRGEALSALCNATSCSAGIEGKGCIEGNAFCDEGREICDQGKGIWDEGKGIWTKGKDPILGSEILRSPYGLLFVCPDISVVACGSHGSRTKHALCVIQLPGSLC